MDVRIDPSWKKVLQKEFEKPYFQELTEFIRKEYKKKKVFPPPQKIFRAFDATPFDEVKVVILGQDPYHGPKQANGLCFSVEEGLRKPPSLQNIFKEINDDLGQKIPESGSLKRWSKQGVLLLNATLTVEARSPGSHQHQGWEEFTDAAIRILSEKRENLVFLLWGAYAKKKGKVVSRKNGHLILEAPHPSPFSASRGFFGCKHFSKTNKFLEENGMSPIDW